MAYMFEGLKKLYTGSEMFSRQLALFSVCGIAGIANGYFILSDYTPLTLLQKIIFGFLLVLFNLLLTGYEVNFMHDRQIPEISIDTFKLALAKIPFAVFLTGAVMLLISLFTKYENSVFWLGTVLSVPLAMLLAGFSNSYNNGEADLPFKKFRIFDYVKLFLKELWVILLGYSFAFVVMLILFIIGGIVLAVLYNADAALISSIITDKQTAIFKLSAYMLSILIYYSVTIGNLMWDYEVVRRSCDECNQFIN